MGIVGGEVRQRKGEAKFDERRVAETGESGCLPFVAVFGKKRSTAQSCWGNHGGRKWVLKLGAQEGVHSQKGGEVCTEQTGEKLCAEGRYCWVGVGCVWGYWRGVCGLG